MEHQLEEVFTWLEAGDAADYQAGVLLLQKHSRNRGLVGLLLKKESAANREKLVYELVKIGCGGRVEEVSEVLNHFAQAVRGFGDAAQVAVQQAAAAVAVVNALVEQPEPDQVLDELRPQLDDLTQLMSRVYNQRCQLSNSLATLDPADGPRVVGEILALEQQYNALAQKRRNLAAGEQPAAPAEPAAAETPAPDAEESVAPGLDRAELVLKRNALRSNLSKAKKKAEESKTEEKRSEYTQKAAKLEVEISAIEMQLASLASI